MTSRGSGHWRNGTIARACPGYREYRFSLPIHGSGHIIGMLYVARGQKGRV